MHTDEIVPLEKIKDLYLKENLTLEAIAERLHISKQAVHSRLTTANVKFRTRGNEGKVISKDMIVALYVTQLLPRYLVAKELGISFGRLTALLKDHNIEIRTKRPDQRKYPELSNLKVGEILLVNVEGLRKNCHVNFYAMAKRLGIRVAVKRIDMHTMRITRVE